MRAERLDQDTCLSRVVIARVVELPFACARANGAGQMRAERDGRRDVRERSWTCVVCRWCAHKVTAAGCAHVELVVSLVLLVIEKMYG